MKSLMSKDNNCKILDAKVITEVYIRSVLLTNSLKMVVFNFMAMHFWISFELIWQLRKHAGLHEVITGRISAL